MQRRRSVPHTFEERIAAAKAKLEAKQLNTSDRAQREALVEKIRQLETAIGMNEWLSSPGLRPPT